MNKSEAVRRQRIAIVFGQQLHIQVVFLFVLGVKARGGSAHRRIYNHGNNRDAVFVFEFAQVVNQQLRAPNGKGRDDYLATAFDRLIDDFGKAVFRINVFVRAIAVRGFDQQVIRCRERARDHSESVRHSDLNHRKIKC